MATRISINGAKKLGISTIRDYKGKQQVTNVLNGKIIKVNPHNMTSFEKNGRGRK